MSAQLWQGPVSIVVADTSDKNGATGLIFIFRPETSISNLKEPLAREIEARCSQFVRQIQTLISDSYSSPTTN